MRSDVYVSMCLSCAFVLGASMPIRVYRGCTIKHFRPVVVAVVVNGIIPPTIIITVIVIIVTIIVLVITVVLVITIIGSSGLSLSS